VVHVPERTSWEYRALSVNDRSVSLEKFVFGRLHSVLIIRFSLRRTSRRPSHCFEGPDREWPLGCSDGPMPIRVFALITRRD
jgi:hypothetical protein